MSAVQLLLPVLAPPALPPREVRHTAREYRGTYADGRVWRTRMYLRDGVTVHTTDMEE